LAALGQVPAAGDVHRGADGDHTVFTPLVDHATAYVMRRIVSRIVSPLLVLGVLVVSCGGSKKGPEAPEGFKVCTYCCTTANITCSCDVIEAVECPAPDQTGSLSACAECRSCTKRVGPEESCQVD
jgi:hypothetical protein